MIRYLQNSIENMRDIGGYKNNEGGIIKLGKLIRSNLPINLSNKDISIINKMGINTIIDLRSYEEIKSRKSIFEGNKDFNIYHIGMNIGKDIPEEEEFVPKSYIEMLTLQKEIKKIFEILSKGDRIIYFCNAGKDRTGVAAFLILSALGVSEKQIVEDYLYTNLFFDNYSSETINDALESESQTEIAQRLNSKTAVIAETIEVLPKACRVVSGSVARFLEEKLGMTKAKIERLQELYLE